MKKYSILFPLFLVYFIPANATEPATLALFKNNKPLFKQEKMRLRAAAINVDRVLAPSAYLRAYFLIMAKQMIITDSITMKSPIIILENSTVFNTLIVRTSLLVLHNCLVSRLKVLKPKHNPFQAVKIQLLGSSSLASLEPEKGCLLNLNKDDSAQSPFEFADNNNPIKHFFDPARKVAIDELSLSQQ